MSATEARINRRWVVGHCDEGVYLVYHSRPLSADEKEFEGNPREHLSARGFDKALHEPVVFTQADQSYPTLAALLG